MDNVDMAAHEGEASCVARMYHHHTDPVEFDRSEDIACEEPARTAK
jgi:hypothetical protein